MEFVETNLPGVINIKYEIYKDERGFFGRSYLQSQFEENGIKEGICDYNISYNKKKFTIRGMHYQKDPHGQAKFVHCLKGSIYDVVIDIRPESPNYLKTLDIELSEDSYEGIYIPAGFAHGFQTLKDDSIVGYFMFNPYKPEFASGYRWDDPKFNISWPENEKVIISDRDANYELLK